MPGKKSIFWPLALLIACSMPARGAEQWTMVDGQFQSRSVAVDRIDAGGVHLTGTGGAAEVCKWNEILELSRSANPLPPQGDFELALSSGDRMPGQPVSTSDENLLWNSPALGNISIPLSHVSAIFRRGKAPSALDDPRKDDVVMLANGDITHGIVTDVDKTSVTLQSGPATPKLSFDVVIAILFATPPAAAAAAGGFRVAIRDGSAITVRSLSLEQGKLTLNLNAKASVQIDSSSVSLIEQLNGPVSWLTSRRPAENVYKPFFSENFPTRFDRTYVGDGVQPLSFKYPNFRHGIGCHSYSRLVYDLDGTYAGFRTQFAITSDSPLADVTVRIKLDGATAFEQQNVKGGKVYPVRLIPLNGAKTLTLEVDYGANYATEDRFVWLDPALIRQLPPQPATAPSATIPATRQ